MKVSLTIAAVILALGMSLGWSNHQRFAVARDLHERLSKAAGQSSDGTSGRTKSTRRVQRKPEVRAKIVAADFLAFSRERRQALSSGEFSGNLQNLNDHSAVTERVRALNPEELRALIQELRATPEIGGVECGNFVDGIIQEMADARPEVALELLFSTNDPKALIKGYVIVQSIRNWAEEDPDAALKWLRENEGTVPADSINEVKKSLLKGAASRDPAAACRMLGGLGAEGALPGGIFYIVGACKTPEMRTAVMTARSEFLATIADPKKRLLVTDQIDSALGYDAAMEGFESGSKWIASANLTAGGLAGLAMKLGDNISKVNDGDTGKWVRWAGDTLPAGEVDQCVRRMVGNWARADFRAAADWIRTAPDGPLKNASTRAYAEAVSQFEPNSAVEWAVTLPAGKERDATFKTIHKNWLEKDAEGAAAFALKYGIQ